VFAPAQLLRRWSEQRPSNEDDLQYNVLGGGWECLLHGDETVSDVIFVPWYVNLCALRFKLNTLYSNFGTGDGMEDYYEINGKK
jgi:hypothetical protein